MEFSNSYSSRIFQVGFFPWINWMGNCFLCAPVLFGLTVLYFMKVVRRSLLIIALHHFRIPSSSQPSLFFSSGMNKSSFRSHSVIIIIPEVMFYLKFLSFCPPIHNTTRCYPKKRSHNSSSSWMSSSSHSSLPFMMLTDPEFFRAMANSLTDFTEVNQVTPLVTLFTVSSLFLSLLSLSLPRLSSRLVHLQSDGIHPHL